MKIVTLILLICSANVFAQMTEEAQQKPKSAVLLVEEEPANPAEPQTLLISEEKAKELPGWVPVPTVGVRGIMMFYYMGAGAQGGIRTLNGYLEAGVFLNGFTYGASTIYNYGHSTGIYGQIGLLKDPNGNNARVYIKGRYYNVLQARVHDSQPDPTYDYDAYKYTAVGIGGSLGFSLCRESGYVSIGNQQFCPFYLEGNFDHQERTYFNGETDITNFPSAALIIKF